MKQIKKTSLILLFCFFIFSCKKYNQRNSYNNLITGKWNNLTIENKLNNVPFSSDTIRRVSYTFSKGEYIEFFDDGTLIDFGGDQYHYPYTPSSHSGTYSINGSTLYTIVNYPSQSFYDTLQIQTLTDSILTLYKSSFYSGGTQEEWNNFLR
jgi:hypothetical protein